MGVVAFVFASTLTRCTLTCEFVNVGQTRRQGCGSISLWEKNGDATNY